MFPNDFVEVRADDVRNQMIIENVYLQQQRGNWLRSNVMAVILILIFTTKLNFITTELKIDRRYWYYKVLAGASEIKDRPN